MTLLTSNIFDAILETVQSQGKIICLDSAFVDINIDISEKKTFMPKVTQTRFSGFFVTEFTTEFTDFSTEFSTEKSFKIQNANTLLCNKFRV